MINFLKRHKLVITSLALSLLSLQIALNNVKGIGGTIITGRLISAVAVPIQYVITSTVNGIKSMWGSYIYLVNVNEENDVLRKNVAGLMDENNRLKELVMLNDRLKSLLFLKEQAGMSAVAANVIGVEQKGWLRTITINKGASDGIGRDMAVATLSGIVGRTIDVHPDSSKVLLVTDPRCNIDVIMQRNRMKGITEGNGTGRLILKYVNHSDDIQIGDTIISSGLGGVFPKGMIVGEIVSIEKGDDNFFMNIEVRPGADLERLEEVLVLTGNNILSEP